MTLYLMISDSVKKANAFILINNYFHSVFTQDTGDHLCIANNLCGEATALLVCKLLSLTAKYM